MFSTMSRLMLVPLAFVMTLSPLVNARAQSDAPPGLRGAFYESPSFGWIVLLPGEEWTVANVESGGGDLLHLVSETGDGADHYVLAYPDDGRGAAGCIEDAVDLLAETSPDQPLQGWNGDEIEYLDLETDRPAARVRIADPDDSAFDLLAFLRCTLGESGLLLAETVVQTARDMEAMTGPLSLTPLLPGEGHTGRARNEGAGAAPENGVVLFLARGATPMEDSFPFSCLEQEAFERPPDPPPSGTGYFVCDGQIANIDTVPAAIDLADIAIGCAGVPESEPLPVECPEAPVRPSHAEILLPPATVNGSVLTLQPGESAEVVIWYALPEGDPPLDILYLEPDRQVRAGPTFFSAGIGSRPKIRVGR